MKFFNKTFQSERYQFKYPEAKHTAVADAWETLTKAAGPPHPWSTEKFDVAFRALKALALEEDVEKRRDCYLRDGAPAWNL